MNSGWFDEATVPTTGDLGGEILGRGEMGLLFTEQSRGLLGLCRSAETRVFKPPLCWFLGESCLA